MPLRSVRLFDTSFETTLDFALPVSADSMPAFTLTESAEPVLSDGPSEEVFSWELESGATWLQVRKTVSDYGMTFPGYADVRVSRDAKRVVFHREPGLPWSTLEHLLLDQVPPLVVSLSGGCVLHCSAVAAPTGALVFAGQAGQGKSTLAAALALSGCSLLTDDALLLRQVREEIMAVPSYPSLRLWPDDTRHFRQLDAEICDVAHYTSKKKLRISRHAGLFAERPVRAAAVYILTEPVGSEAVGGEAVGGEAARVHPCSSVVADVEIEKLSPREAFMELLQNSIHLDRTGKGSLKAQSEKLTALANAIPCFRLSYPRDHALLPDVVKAVLAHAGNVKREET